MRVALLFYGQARHVSNTPEYGSVVNTLHHEILSKYNTDVFGHVWWSGKNKTYVNSTWSQISKVPVELSDSILVLNSVFRPKILTIEPPRIFEYDTEIKKYHDENLTKTLWWTAGTVNHSNVLSQLYSISQASKLVEKYSIENSVKYDAVVMTRYDSQIWDLPNLNTIDPNKLYTQRVDFDGKTFDDNLLVFNPKYLEWTSNMFDDVNHVYKDIDDPIPEKYKFATFAKRFATDNIIGYPMRLLALHR
jgi:hypothetical protein